MFMGEFKHSVDAKGRLTIPSKIRNQCQGSVYVARGFDGCLAFYTKEEWDPFCAKLLSLPSNKKFEKQFVLPFQVHVSANLIN